MSKNGRWISREIKHLDDHIAMGIIDVKSDNKASALTNLKLASAIVKQMGINDKNGKRAIERIGKTVGVISKHLRPSD